LAPTKTFFVSGNNGTVLIGNYGIYTGANGDGGAVTDPYSYISSLSFHSGVNYIQIVGKVTATSYVTFPAVSRGIVTWDSGSKSSCFTPNTSISMYDGSYKNIKDIVPGDLVWNKDKTKANTVTFIEKSPARDNIDLYSPTTKLKPFATIDHPLFIDNKYRSPTPKQYIWLNTEYLEPASVAKTTSVCDYVYNLWTTGDHTYIVNGIGTHSIVDDGGAMLHCYEQGLITSEQCAQIIVDVSLDTPEHLYGSYLINKFLHKFNYRIINSLLVYFAVAPRTTIRRQIFKIFSGIVGKVFKKIKEN